jgi:multidrug efflux pump subunit AcrA (membrane-fusion protein)
MRPYITKLIAILLVAGAFFGAKAIIGNKKKNKPKVTVNAPTAFVVNAKNESIPVNVKETGRLSAKYKVDLYAEVQGIMQASNKEFKAGTSFNKGENLVQIKSDDFYANLQAQKSVFQNLIARILPDIKLDYPTVYSKWDEYLKGFDIKKTIPPLPEPSSEKEKLFLTGKDIYTTYYKTKNLEITYQKYTLSAPFNGILTEALVTPGSLVRNGQKLGEYINPSEYELELAVSKALINTITIGKKVTITNPENIAQKWEGTVSRINGKVNATTQTVQIFVTVKGDHLKEGMYMQATIAGQEKLNAIEISRNLLIDDNKIYTVSSDSLLQLKTVSIIHKSEKTAIVQGVTDGEIILYKPIPGAYSGMKVVLKKQD